MSAQVFRLANYMARRTLSGMFPGYFPEAKHDHYRDFGFPKTLDFGQLFAMYSRNGIARAGVDKTVAKTWETMPWLQDHERDAGKDDKETPLEKQIRERFTDLRLWPRLKDADRMSLVGGYSGLILKIGDGGRWSDPVTRAAGLDAFFGVIPAWAGQLTVSRWDADQSSPTYGEPLMYEFKEQSLDRSNPVARQMLIHPDRVFVWSDDRTVNCASLIEPGFNDLMTIEKIVGAGGQGFWKNAKSSPVIEADKEFDIQAMAKALGIKPSDVADKMNEQVEKWSSGFDEMLLLQGMKANALNVTLPSPEHFFGVAIQSFAASIQMPTKILVGMQTGERASTEDATEWAQTNMSRRANTVVPNIRDLVNRLEVFGVLPEKDWHVDWTDLTESSMVEKIDRAVKMADANQKMKDSGEFVFTPEEIREVVDLEPLVESEKYRPEPEADDQAIVEDSPDGA